MVRACNCKEFFIRGGLQALLMETHEGSRNMMKKESHKYEIQTCICVGLVLHTRRILDLIPADPRSTKIEFFELSEINMHGILNMHYLHCKLFQ